MTEARVCLRSKNIIPVLCLLLGVFSFRGLASGHGPQQHDRPSAAAVQMQKLHAMMPMFSVAAAGLEAALEKGDTAAAEAEAAKISAAIPELKKSKPHKNVKQLKKFGELAGVLEASVKATVHFAKKGNLAAAREAFKKMEETCAACHARFRD